jgi:hypothetical protein
MRPPTADSLELADIQQAPVSAAAGGVKEETLPAADQHVGQHRISDSVPCVTTSHLGKPEPHVQA